MACKLLKLTVQLKEAYEKFDLKKVYDLTMDFLAKELADYYLPISRHRLLTKEGSKEHVSTQMIYSKVMITLLQALAPILPLTTQDAYANLKATNSAMVSKELLPEYS